MNEALHIYSASAQTARLAQSAQPTAPIVVEESSDRLSSARSVRLTMSRGLRWLADALEPSATSAPGSPSHSASAC